MKNCIWVVFLSLLIVGVAGCKKINGKGGTVSETRTMPHCTAIDLAMSESVYYTEDSAYSLVLEGQQNILDEVETVTEGQALVIRLKDNTVLGSHDPVKVNIHAPGVSQIAVSGSGMFYVMSLWKGGTLTAGISGSGELQFPEIRASVFNPSISGSGNIRGGSGTAGRMNASTSGSGSMQLEGVRADTVTALISGSGNMTLWAVNLLDATISGSGNIYYKGSPTVTTHISGSGTVKPL